MTLWPLNINTAARDGFDPREYCRPDYVRAVEVKDATDLFIKGKLALDRLAAKVASDSSLRGSHSREGSGTEAWSEAKAD